MSEDNEEVLKKIMSVFESTQETLDIITKAIQDLIDRVEEIEKQLNINKQNQSKALLTAAERPRSN
jgi:hypothetical protein